MRLSLLRLLFISVCICILSSALSAQKKNLTTDDYARWQSIAQSEISPDGNWFSYNISLVDGDGWLAVREIGASEENEHKFMNSYNQQFSNDNRWLVFRIGLPQDEARPRRENQETVRYKLGLMDLHSSEVDTFNNIAGYSISDNSRFLLMRKYKPDESTIRGSDVILRDLNNGSNLLLGNVAESSFNDEGSLFALLIDSHDKIGNGVQLTDLDSMTTIVLESDEAEYRSLTWNDDGTALAFLKKESSEDFEEDTHKIFAFRDLGTRYQKQIFDQSDRTDFPSDMRIVDYRRLQWSDDGERLFFGIKEWTPAEGDGEPDQENETDENSDQENKNDDTEEPGATDEDLPPSNVEVWHWKDDPIQPRQRVLRRSNLEANFLSVWHLDGNRFVQLVDNYEHSVQMISKQNHALLYDPVPYQPRLREEWNDVYVVSVSTGCRKPMTMMYMFICHKLLMTPRTFTQRITVFQIQSG